MKNLKKGVENIKGAMDKVEDMNIIDVVKYDGGPDVFAWKFPEDALGTWTQLIIHESQEAVLFKGGQALDVLMSGRHTLETKNIPLLSKLINLPFGGESPFTAEIWYVNKVHSLDIKWGTASPIQLQDPQYKIFVNVRSYGQFGIQIDNSKKFLIKMVGSLPVFDKQSINDFFKGLYITKVKDTISSYLIKKQISVLEINAYLVELSEHIQERMQDIFDDYGIKLLNFYVNDISIPEDDIGIKKLKNAFAKKAEMDIIGYDYVQERSFDTLGDLAKNPGSSHASVMGAGIGLGMGVGLGEGFGNQMNTLSQEMSVKQYKECSKCNAKVEEGKKFCGNCGNNMGNNEEKPLDKVSCGKCGFLYSKTSKFCPECGDAYNACPKCGIDLDEGVTNCHECGYKMPTPCPKCGVKVGEGYKFCPECGESLINKCSNCQNELKANSKFCPECGQKVKGE